MMKCVLSMREVLGDNADSLKKANWGWGCISAIGAESSRDSNDPGEQKCEEETNDV